MKRVLAVLALVVLADSVTPALAQSNAWTIDTAHSATIFTARHMLVSNVRGQLGPITGTVKYDGKDVRSIEADVVIDVTQLNTRIEARDKHLRSADFFDAENHPTMTFKSKRAEAAGEGRFRLIGDLTIRGNRQEVVLDCEGPTPPLQNRDTIRIGASATTKVSRKAFGLLWNNLLETGGAIVGDEIQVQIDLEVVQKIAPPAE